VFKLFNKLMKYLFFMLLFLFKRSIFLCNRFAESLYVCDRNFLFLFCMVDLHMDGNSWC